MPVLLTAHTNSPQKRFMGLQSGDFATGMALHHFEMPPSVDVTTTTLDAPSFVHQWAKAVIWAHPERWRVASGAHDDVIKWKHFPRYWPFVRRMHWSPMNSPHKGQWRRALMFSLICAWTNGWVHNRKPGDLRHHHAHFDVTVMELDSATSVPTPCAITGLSVVCSKNGQTFCIISWRGPPVLFV